MSQHAMQNHGEGSAGRMNDERRRNDGSLGIWRNATFWSLFTRPSREQAEGLSGCRAADHRMEHEVSNAAFPKQPSISFLTLTTVSSGVCLFVGTTYDLPPSS